MSFFRCDCFGRRKKKSTSSVIGSEVKLDEVNMS